MHYVGCERVLFAIISKYWNSLVYEKSISASFGMLFDPCFMEEPNYNRNLHLKRLH